MLDFGNRKVTLRDRARAFEKPARRSHVTRKIPARKLCRVTLIRGDHEINSGSIAAITPHAARRAVGEGRRDEREEGERRGGRAAVARRSARIGRRCPREKWQERKKGGEAVILRAAAAEGGGAGRADGEKNGKEHGRRRSAPPLEIIACSRGISECGRKAASGERQGPEPGCEKRGKSEARRTGGSREGGRCS